MRATGKLNSIQSSLTVDSGLEVHWDHDGNGHFGERSDLVGNPLTLTWRQLRNLGLGDDGTFQIGARVTNADGVSTYVYQTLVIKTTPIVKPIPNAEILVGELYQVPFSFVDFGNDSVKEWQVSWGDGSPVEKFGYGEEFALHSYDVIGDVDLSITAVRKDGTFFTGTQRVTVVGKPNQIVASAKKMVEGEPLTLTATASGTVLSFGWDVNHDGTVDVSSDAYPYQGDPSRSFGTITIS